MNLRRSATVLGMTGAVALGGLFAPSVASAGTADDHYSYEDCKDLYEEIDDWDDAHHWWHKCGDDYGHKFDLDELKDHGFHWWDHDHDHDKHHDYDRDHHDDQKKHHYYDEKEHDEKHDGKHKKDHEDKKH